MKKPDASQLVVLRTFYFVGDKNLAPNLNQKLGPLGIKAKDLPAQILKSCKEWIGARIFLELHIQNRACTVVPKPGTTSYIIKEMGGFVDRDRKKEKLPPRSGNITFDQVLKIARLVEADGRSQSKTFQGTVKQVLGTCLTVGCTVDGKSPKVVTKQVNSGELTCDK